MYNPILGKSPLHLAAEMTDLEAMRILLTSDPRNRADVNAVTEGEARTALHICAKKKDYKGVELLLNQPGVEV